MTVETALALRAHRMEYILAIEGVGWSSDDADPFSAFVGDVWATGDLDGDLATQLGCTVHVGLEPTGSIGDNVHPLTCVYGIGQLSFRIVSHDDWWLENFTPRKAGDATTLNTALAYDATTVQLVDGTAFSTGDVVWLGGRECVKLGTKALVGGVVHNYTGSTRGYLGTTRGRANGMPSSASAFAWAAGVNVYSRHRFWADRAMRLYAHVPGEARSGMALLWIGKLSSLRTSNVGHTVSLSGTGEVMRQSSRVWRPRECTVISNTYGHMSNRVLRELPNRMSLPVRGGIRTLIVRPLVSSTTTELGENLYALAAAYRYRTEPGGTAGMRAAWDAGTVQALDSENGEDVDLIMRFAVIQDRIFRVLKRDPNTDNPNQVTCETFSSLGFNESQTFDENTGLPVVELFDDGTPCRFLLDNHDDAWELNHYAVNQKVVRHPINLLLSHLTTRDDEYVVEDATGASTTSVVVFAGTSMEVDAFVGAALHCVEGNNKGQARLITANTATTVTVDEAFDGGAVAAGDEFQIRNSIYDTLPIGWGLGIPWTRIDIASFEDVRDRYMQDAEVGKFLMGTQDKLDLWKILQDEILSPYGILVYFSRTTGKLAAQYIGQAAGDGIIHDYVAVTDSDFIEIGEIDNSVDAPIGTLLVTVRALEDKCVGFAVVGTTHVPFFDDRGNAQIQQIVDVMDPIRAVVPATMGGEETKVEHKLAEFEAYTDNNKEEMELSALFNTRDDIEFVSARCFDLLRQYAVPPPRTRLVLGPAFMTSVRAGTYLTLTKTDGVANPFTGERGWSQVVAFVTSTQLRLTNGPGIECQVLLLEDVRGTRIAPASKLDGALVGTDGTSDWFVVAPYEYQSDAAGDKDYYGFAVGDRIVLHNQDGSEHAATFYTIRSFGANDSATPSGASSDIIRVVGIGVVPAAGGIDADHYLTFDGYDASTTVRMQAFAAYGDAAGALTGGDDAGVYL